VIKANNAKMIKEANRYLTLNCVREHEPISQEGIVMRTRLSRPTVTNIIKELLEAGLVEKSGYGESSGGRSPVLLSLNSQAVCSIGVDFEFPQVRIAISDLKFNIVQAREWQFSLKDDKEYILQTLIDRIEELMHQSGIPLDKFAGIGIGLPGVIDFEQGVSVFIERIAEWRNVQFRDILQQKFNIPVFIRNDVHLMALAETKLYPQSSTDQFIYIGIRHRHGIGMAIIMDNKIYEGTKGNAGYIGHITLDPHGAPCVCGNRGCLETFVGEAAIQKYLREKTNGKEYPNSSMMLKDLVVKANMGDKIAVEVLQEAAGWLGIGVANVVKLFEIPTVIIGGISTGDGHNVFIEAVEQEAASRIFASVKNEFTVSAGYCDESNYALGGCILAIEHYYQEPKLNLYHLY
jgi:predicted NBD/HSP70 family sugar kinase